MNRIYNKKIQIIKNTSISQFNNILYVKGTLGVLNLKIHKGIKINVSNNIITINKNKSKDITKIIGTYYTLINNMIIGVNKGFTKILQITGTGYKSEIEKNNLYLHLGYSHKINYIIPSDIMITLQKDNEINVFGLDKQKVGQTASDIRAMRIPDCYKGKGIKYKNESLVLKIKKKSR